jgi:hypothetical protein
MMTMTDPGKIAAADQTAARQFDDALLGAGVSIALAAPDGIATMQRVNNGDPSVSAASDLIWARFQEWCRTGTVRACRHDPMSEPAMYWLPWEPALVCVDCCNVIMADTNGTEQDRTCDGCGTVTPVSEGILMCNQVRSGGVSADGKVMPPVIIAFGLCRACDDVSGKGERDAQG